MTIKRGYSAQFKFKDLFIGSIASIKEDIEIETEIVGSSIFVRYEGIDGAFIQYVCDKIIYEKIGGNN